MAKELKRSKNKMIAGIAAGFAEYFDVDVTLMRIIFAVVTLCTRGGFALVYLICLLIMKDKN
ncbi:MAG: PspC domain-containing protein [Paludibacteraceae bacterium]|nr:PspC domain-containing protein [Paludibacteraceae bacterium]